MKTLCNLCKKLQFCEPKKQPIDIETLCKIIGNLKQKDFKEIPNKDANNSAIVEWDLIEEDDEDREKSFRVMPEPREYNIKDHIIIEKSEDIYTPETSDDYHTNYKITIKNLVITVARDETSKTVILDILDSTWIESGIYLIFENNHFVSPSDVTSLVSFHPRNKAYLILKGNEFKSVDMCLHTIDSYKIELTGNRFTDSDIEISSTSDLLDTPKVQPNIVCLENNIFHRNDGISSKLKFDGEKEITCYFKGKNTVDNLIISTNGYLNWSGYQNIDPKGKHAYTHKKMFINFMKKAVKENDKIQESQLRRELLKCERALIRKEKFWRSLQDRIILGWSSLVSDYGISWIRPMLGLFIINALLATVVYFSPSQDPSWWFLFFDFLNPLSNLSNSAGIENNIWIAFINVMQKAFLALFLYEIIKIFRRFSK